MAYVINVPHHELPYGELLTRIFEAFEALLDDREGEEPVKKDFYDETFLRICQLRRENGAWWLGSGEEEDKDSDNTVSARSTATGFQWEQVEEDAEVEGEPKEIKSEFDGLGFVDMFYDAEDKGNTAAEDTPTTPVMTVEKKKGKSKDSGVDPSGHIPDYDLLHL
ncbi:hypothetical protein Dimus_000717 [Dionaea muscipula]